MRSVMECACAGSLMVVLLTFSAFAIAAQQQENETTAEDVRQELTETYQVLKSYSVKQRDKALSVAEQKLAELDHRIDSLQKRLDNNWQTMSKAGRQQVRETLRTLQQKREKVAEWYGGLRHSSAEAWEEVKQGFSDSFDRLQQAFAEAQADLQDQDQS